MAIKVRLNKKIEKRGGGLVDKSNGAVIAPHKYVKGKNFMLVEDTKFVKARIAAGELVVVEDEKEPKAEVKK